MSLSNVRILLVDDDLLHLEICSEWLSSFGAKVQVAANGDEALAIVRPAAFDVALVDLRMPGISGLQLLDLLKEKDPSMEIVFLTGSGTMGDAIAALKQGRAFDFLLKPLADMRILNQSIAQALEHRRQSLAMGRAGSEEQLRLMEDLTPRERETLSLLVKGLDNQQIAERLDLKEKTVRNVLTRIYEKLKVNSRAQAIVLCRELGIT